MAAIHTSITLLEWINTLGRRSGNHARAEVARVAALYKIKTRIINDGYSADELKHLAEVVSKCEHSSEFFATCKIPFTKNNC